MSYVTGIVASSIAAAIVLMICAGGKHEKLCTSVCCAFIALSALIPLRSVFNAETSSQIEREVAGLRDKSTERVVGACRAQLERRVADAVAKEFDGAEVPSVVIECDDTDIGNIKVMSCSITVSGADGDEVERYVGELLCCDEISVIIEGGDRNGYQKDT